MGLQKVYLKQHFSAGDSLENYFEALKLKSNRTPFENQLLELYNKANTKGEEFCMQKVKERINEIVSQNKGLIVIGSLALLLIVAKSKKWI